MVCDSCGVAYSVRESRWLGHSGRVCPSCGHDHTPGLSPRGWNSEDTEAAEAELRDPWIDFRAVKEYERDCARMLGRFFRRIMEW